MKFSLKQTIALSKKLCEQIKLFDPDVVVAIEKGGLLPGIEIARKLNKKLVTISIRREYDKRLEKLYQKGTDEERKNISKKVDEVFLKTNPELIKKVAFKFENKKVLIVDDAVHTGKTLEIAKNYIFSKKPLEIKTAVLFYVDQCFSDYYLGKGEHEYPWSTWAKFKLDYNKLLDYYSSNMSYIKKSKDSQEFTELKSFPDMKNKYFYFSNGDKIFFRIINKEKKYKDFLISNRNNIPRSGIVLLEAIPEGKNKTFLELGTGSNALLPLCAGWFQYYSECIGSEIDKNSIKTAKQAVAYSGQRNVKLVHSDLFSNIKDKFDVIASNPPYTPLPMGKKVQDNYDYGGYDGYEVIDRIIKNSPGYLNKRGELYLIIADYLGIKERNGIHESLFECLRQNGFKPKIVSSKIRCIKKEDATNEALNHILSIYPDAKFKISGKLTSNREIIANSYKKGIKVCYNVVVVQGVLNKDV